VGRIVAATVAAPSSKAERFASSARAIRFRGLIRSISRSASREARGHERKDGSSELLAMLREAARHPARLTHSLHAYF
jgi:transposase